MIYPYLQYYNIVWGSAYPTNLNRITLLQNVKLEFQVQVNLMRVLVLYLRNLAYTEVT